MKNSTIILLTTCFLFAGQGVRSQGPTKRSHDKINMTPIEWKAFKNKYGIRTDSIHTVFDAKLYAPVKVKADLKGDKQSGWMAIIPPQDTLKDNAGECMGGCDSHIIFSDPALPVIRVERNLGGDISRVADLDGDGADEILVTGNWWQGSWFVYHVYSYSRKDKKWYDLVTPITIYLNDMDKKVLVKKSKRKGYVSAYTSVSDDKGIRSAYKDLKIIKPLN